MHYRIIHVTHYDYPKPVRLKPHIVRLRPRSDNTQRLNQFSLQVDPSPAQLTPLVDLDGTDAFEVWFEAGKTSMLQVKTCSEVETLRSNPFDFLCEPWAATLPIDYPASLLSALNPYLHSALSPTVDAGVGMLAQEILHSVNGNVGYFLTTLTQHIYENCDYTVRHTGDPFSAGITWARKQGSCRDYTVLFMEACRAVGLAARFVSGYQEGDPDVPDADLHAWAEVYLPGGGWRGYDPTHGLAVADRHIAVAASAHPRQSAPIAGAIYGDGAGSATLNTQVSVEVLSSSSI